MICKTASIADPNIAFALVASGKCSQTRWVCPASLVTRQTNSSVHIAFSSRRCIEGAEK